MPGSKYLLTPTSYHAYKVIEMENVITKLMTVIQREYKSFYVSIQLTKKCNFKCMFCYQMPDKCNFTDEIDNKDWYIIVDKLFTGGCKVIKFSGGEILCYKYFYDVYLYTWNKGILITLYTNGYLIDENCISFLKNYPPHKIRISIYGNNDENYYKFSKIKNGWGTVSRNIARLVQAGINVEVSIVLNKFNFKFAHEILKFSELYNIKCSFFTMVNAFIDGNKETLKLQLSACEIKKLLIELGYWDKYREKIKCRNGLWNNNTKICNVGISSFNIDSLGRAYLCDYEQTRKISLINHSLTNVQEELRKERAEKIDIVTKCSFCKQKNVCGVCFPIYNKVFGNGEDGLLKRCLWGENMQKIINDSEEIN